MNDDKLNDIINASVIVKNRENRFKKRLAKYQLAIILLSLAFFGIAVYTIIK